MPGRLAEGWLQAETPQRRSAGRTEHVPHQGRRGALSRARRGRYDPQRLPRSEQGANALQGVGDELAPDPDRRATDSRRAIRLPSRSADHGDLRRDAARGHRRGSSSRLDGRSGGAAEHQPNHGRQGIPPAAPDHGGSGRGRLHRQESVHAQAGRCRALAGDAVRHAGAGDSARSPTARSLPRHDSGGGLWWAALGRARQPAPPLRRSPPRRGRRRRATDGAGQEADGRSSQEHGGAAHGRAAGVNPAGTGRASGAVGGAGPQWARVPRARGRVPASQQLPPPRLAAGH